MRINVSPNLCDPAGVVGGVEIIELTDGWHDVPTLNSADSLQLMHVISMINVKLEQPIVSSESD